MGQLVTGGKITNKEHLDRVAKQTGRDPEKLYDLPEIEQELLYLFRHYCNVKGQEPLTFQELDAWTRLTGTELTPGEVDILFMLDTAFYETRQNAE